MSATVYAELGFAVGGVIIATGRRILVPMIEKSVGKERSAESKS